MIDDEIVQKAMELATKAHAGQLDKSGHPYIGHLERVATMVQRSGGHWVQVAAAWLHDSLEDTTITSDELHRQFPRVVVEAVEAMTHLKNEPNADYWQRVRTNEFAVLIKFCDIYDNLDPARMCYLDKETRDRLRKKYGTALAAIAGGPFG